LKNSHLGKAERQVPGKQRQFEESTEEKVYWKTLDVMDVKLSELIKVYGR
jgi:hypothetical protein